MVYKPKWLFYIRLYIHLCDLFSHTACRNNQLYISFLYSIYSKNKVQNLLKQLQLHTYKHVCHVLFLAFQNQAALSLTRPPMCLNMESRTSVKHRLSKKKHMENKHLPQTQLLLPITSWYTKQHQKYKTWHPLWKKLGMTLSVNVQKKRVLKKLKCHIYQHFIKHSVHTMTKTGMKTCWCRKKATRRIQK